LIQKHGVEVKPKEIFMPELSVKDLLEAGCHFGHQTARWNPKMKPYIFAAKNGVHIINLDKTVDAATSAGKFVTNQVALGQSVIFVGTKRQAADIIREQAERVNMHYVNQRWLGGMLTNFRTIKASIDRLQGLYQRRDAGEFEKLPKKESLGLQREIEKLEHSLGGIKTMVRLPGVVFIIDPKTEHIALKEAMKLKLPIVAITDTNCDPDGIDFVFPANDDAIKSIALLSAYFADACEEGLKRREVVLREEALAKAKARPSEEAAAARAKEKAITGKAKAYVADARPGHDKRHKKGPGGRGPGSGPVKEKKTEPAKAATANAAGEKGEKAI